MFKLLFLCYLFELTVSELEDCGRANLELGSTLFAITGDDSEEVKAPWIAAVGAFRYSEDGNEEKFVVTCSGTILSRTHVITAAHCFDDGVPILPEFVRVGVTRIDQSKAMDRRIKEVMNHPDWNNNYYFDVALLVLERLTFSKRVYSLCLPETPYTHPGDGVTILVHGWGEDINGRTGSQVSEAIVSVRSSEECDHRYELAGPSSKEEVRFHMPKLTNSVMICADAALDAQQGVCNGDSGGPAFFRKFVKGVYRFFLVGIVEGNPSGCFDKTLPDAYNFVGNEKILQWLNSQLESTTKSVEQLRWSPWSPCSKSCGGGEKRRLNHLGQTERGECNNQPCPQPQWSPWSPCSKSCGKGQQMRINDADQTERRECSTQSCPLTWSTWSSCSATCGGGTRRRTRSDGRIENQKCNSSRCPFAGRRNKSTFPAHLDWSERGFVSPVLDNSDECASNPAVATASAIESCLAIESNTTPTPISVQQLIDCTNGLTAGDGTELYRENRACESSFPDIYLQWALDSKQPLQSARSYPLTGTYGSCRKWGRSNIFKSAVLTDYEYKYFTDEEHLLELVQDGPVVSWFDVGVRLQYYTEGVFYDPETCSDYEEEYIPPECKGSNGLGYTCLRDCKNKLPLHCDRLMNPDSVRQKNLVLYSVLVVGYGTDRGHDYWKVKNTWGTEWGENGYMKVLRGVGHCGIGSYVMQPICQS